MERKLICYCFGYSDEDIIRDVIENRGHFIHLGKDTEREEERYV